MNPETIALNKEIDERHRRKAIRREAHPMPLAMKMGGVALRGLAHLPLWALYGLSTAAYWGLYKIGRYRRDVVRGNLAIAFPHKTDEERLAIEKRFYRFLCDFFAETLKAVSIPAEEQERRFRISNAGLINSYIEQGRSVFLCGAHIGNWEWFNVYSNTLKGCQIQAVYQLQRNDLVNNYMIECHKRLGITPVESHNTYRHMMKCWREGVLTATMILGDQSPHWTAKKHWTTFFGRDTAFLMGPATIAKRANLVLLYPYFTKYSRGHYEVEIKIIEENPAEMEIGALINRYAALVEDNVRQLPELWLWSHRRWKHKHEDFPGQDC